MLFLYKSALLGGELVFVVLASYSCSEIRGCWIFAGYNPVRRRNSAAQKSREDLLVLSRFELQYGFHGFCDAVDILETILQDISSHQLLHDWDETLVGDAVKDLVRFANEVISPVALDL